MKWTHYWRKASDRSASIGPIPTLPDKGPTNYSGEAGHMKREIGGRQ